MITKDQFEETFQGMVSYAAEVFEKDGYHTHLVFLMVDKDGGNVMALIPFDHLMNAVATQMNAGKEDLFKVKRATFEAIANIAKETKAYGYAEISEGWVMVHEIASREKDGDLQQRAEQMKEKHHHLMEQYGSLEHVPGRAEMLFVRAVFADQIKTHMWTIRRGADLKPTLVNGNTSTVDAAIIEHSDDNASLIDRIVIQNYNQAVKG